MGLRKGFENEEQCEHFLDGQISYGYGITSYTLLDLSRMGFNFVEYYYLENKNIDVFIKKFSIFQHYYFVFLNSFF